MHQHCGPDAYPNKATALTDTVSRHRLLEFAFFGEISLASVIPGPAKLSMRDTHLLSKGPASSKELTLSS